MPFETLYQCRDCKKLYTDIPPTHDCPSEHVALMKQCEELMVKQAEEQRPFVDASWDAWLAGQGLDHEPGCPSVDNLPTERAFEGRCVIFGISYGWQSGTDSAVYRTSIMTNPTWGRVYRKFVDSMKITGDTHHSFLEGLHTPARNTLPLRLRSLPLDVVVLEFSTGS